MTRGAVRCMTRCGLKETGFVYLREEGKELQKLESEAVCSKNRVSGFVGPLVVYPIVWGI